MSIRWCHIKAPSSRIAQVSAQLQSVRNIIQFLHKENVFINLEIKTQILDFSFCEKLRVSVDPVMSHQKRLKRICVSRHIEFFIYKTWIGANLLPISTIYVAHFYEFLYSLPFAGWIIALLGALALTQPRHYWLASPPLYRPFLSLAYLLYIHKRQISVFNVGTYHGISVVKLGWGDLCGGDYPLTLSHKLVISTQSEIQKLK